MTDVMGKLAELIYSNSPRLVEALSEILANRLIANGVTVQEWIPVNDRLPIEEAIAFEEEWDDYPEFLVMIDGGYLPTTLYYDWEKNEWFKINTALEREKYKVTHWMSLPQPPKGEGGGDNA